MKQFFVIVITISALWLSNHAQAQTYHVIPSTCTHVYWSYTKDRFGRTIERPVCLNYSRPQTIVIPDRRRYNRSNNILSAIIAGVASYYVIDRSNRWYYKNNHRRRHPHSNFTQCVHWHRNRPCR